MAKGNHSFTEQDIRKRFSAIVGHTVAEVDSAGVLAQVAEQAEVPPEGVPRHPDGSRAAG